MNDSDITESGIKLADISYLFQWYLQVHYNVSEIARKILSALTSARFNKNS